VLAPIASGGAGMRGGRGRGGAGTPPGGDGGRRKQTWGSEEDGRFDFDRYDAKGRKIDNFKAPKMG